MALCASRRSVFIQNVENDVALEFGLLANQYPDVHGVNLRIGQPNDKRAGEVGHVLEGLLCTLCCDPTITWHDAAMTTLSHTCIHK